MVSVAIVIYVLLNRREIPVCLRLLMRYPLKLLRIRRKDTGMAKNAKGGRPAKPYRKKYGFRVVVLFPNEEKTRIREASARAGKPLSEWARDLMLGAAGATS